MQRLVVMMENEEHLPKVLQLLGCIAQIAMPVFQTEEKRIIKFVCCKLLHKSNVWLPNKILILYFLIYFSLPTFQNLALVLHWELLLMFFQDHADVCQTEWENMSEICFLKVQWQKIYVVLKFHVPYVSPKHKK